MSHRKILKKFSISLFSSLFFILPCSFSQENQASEKSEKEIQEAPPAPPTDITSDTMDFDMENRQAIFLGNVKVLEKSLTLNSDKLIVKFDEDNQLETIIASGNVVVTAEENKATGGEAVYDFKSGMITLTGVPELIQGTSRIVDAEKIIYNRKAGKFQAKGGRPRIIWYDDKGLNDTFDKMISRD